MSARAFRNPVIAGARGDDHGDPFVLRYLDSFYLYHSGETHGRRGISVYRSDDLVTWERQGFALEPADSGWAWSDLWAPEVVYERGTFYMYVSGTTRRAPGDPPGRWQQGEGDESRRRVGVARSRSPVGPFVPDPEPLVDVWSIDGHPYRDDDGAMWLFYNVRTDELGPDDALPGTGTVCARLGEPDHLSEVPFPVTMPSEAWEGVPAGDWYWNEAPFVLKRRGRYYQLFSGGWYGDATYAVGLAEAGSPEGPWHKHPANPILAGSGSIRGPGHVSFVFGPDVTSRYAVYHGYVGDEPGRKVLLDRLRWAGDRPVIEGPTADPQPAPPPPVVDPDVPHRRAEAWVRGSWVEVASTRFGLSPAHVWHQVEVVQADGRYAVRVGGVLRASRPGLPAADEELFHSDGEVTAVTQATALEDADLHPVPADSSYAWRWGGSGPLELSLAAKGTLEVTFDGDGTLLEGDPHRFRLLSLARDSGAREVGVRAVGEAATVADLVVAARP